MPGVSVSSPALENSIPAERGIASLSSRIVWRPAGCKFLLVLNVHPRRQLDRLVFTFPAMQDAELGALVAICAPKTRRINDLQCSRHVCLHMSKHLYGHMLNKMIILLFAHGSQFKKEGLQRGCITAQHCKANRYLTSPEHNQHSTCQMRHMAFCNAVTAFKGGKAAGRRSATYANHHFESF